MNASIGASLTRVDGGAKVTGAARYAADFNQPGQLYAVIVGATVGLGRVTGIEAAAVEAMPGIEAVVTHLNAPRLAYRPHKAVIDPDEGERLHVLQDDAVRFFGQPVALVIADTLDHAERGAAALRVAYEARQPLVEPTDARASRIVPATAERTGAFADQARGDADSGLAASAVRVDETYEIARENHNPMEPHATVAAWQGGRLTLWSKSQYLANEKAEIAAVFGLPEDDVEVICPFVGGGFGTSLRTWPHVTLAALAAPRRAVR